MIQESIIGKISSVKSLGLNYPAYIISIKYGDRVFDTAVLIGKKIPNIIKETGGSLEDHNIKVVGRFRETDDLNSDFWVDEIYIDPKLPRIRRKKLVRRLNK